MPARVIVVHNDRTFLDPLANILRAEGHEVLAFDNPVPAWDVLGNECTADILVTRVRFPNSAPHGLALARRAHSNRREIQVLFTASPEMRPYVDGLGSFLPMPASPFTVADAVNRMLSNKEAA